MLDCGLIAVRAMHDGYLFESSASDERVLAFCNDPQKLNINIISIHLNTSHHILGIFL